MAISKTPLITITTITKILKTLSENRLRNFLPIQLPASAIAIFNKENPGFERQLKQITEEVESADYTIHINTGLIEVSPMNIISWGSGTLTLDFPNIV